jgi:serine/threonine-protein kinase
LLQNADYLSVRYDNDPDVSRVSNSSRWQSYDTVTVDLRTGRALTTGQTYRPGAAGPLADVLVATGQMCESADLNPTRDLTLTEENLGDQVKVAFTRDHASFTVELPNLDRPDACGVPTVDIPYDRLADVLDPTLVHGLTVG